MAAYIPSKVAFVTCGMLNYGDGERHEVVKLYCSKFKPAKGKQILFQSKQIAYDSIQIVSIDKNNVRAIIDTEHGKFMLHRNTLSSGPIANMILDNGIDKEGNIEVELGLVSTRNGSSLQFSGRNSEQWQELSATGPIREKSFKSSELKIGNVYAQLLKGRSGALLYVGRMRDPSRENKLSYCFIETNWSKLPPLDGPEFKYKIQASFDSFFTFEEEDAPRWRSSKPSTLELKPSVPSNLVLDHGSFDLATLNHPDGTPLAPEGIEEKMQETINSQWMDYKESIEYRKLQGSYSKQMEAYGVKKFLWKPPNPPAWITWNRRTKAQ